MARLFGLNSEIQFSEGAAEKRQTILRVGNYKKAGKIISLTADHLKSMEKNFKDNVKKTKLALDYGHDAAGPAAAWMKDVQFDEKSGELTFVPKWTPDGLTAVKNEDYAYLSADFDLDYEDNESGKKFGPTLNGAGLTNRPFVKGMESIQLSEGDCEMNLEQALAMIEQLKAQIAQLQPQAQAAPAAQQQLGQMQQKFSEAETKIKELSDKISEHEKAEKLSAKTKQFDDLMKAGKACEAQRSIFMEENFDAVKFAEAFVAPHTERLSEEEKQAAKDADKAKGAETKILQFADVLVKEKGVDKATAIGMVLSDVNHKAIVDEYNKNVSL